MEKAFRALVDIGLVANNFKADAYGPLNIEDYDSRGLDQYLYKKSGGCLFASSSAARR